MLRVLLASIAMFAALFAPAQSQSDAPAAKGPAKKVAAPAKGGGGGSAALVFYVPCPLMAVLTGLNTGPTAEVLFDNKPIGTVPSCGHRTFKVPAGVHGVNVHSAGWPRLDFGLVGPQYTFAAGQPVYIRAVYYKYFESRQIPADIAKADIAAINKRQ